MAAGHDPRDPHSHKGPVGQFGPPPPRPVARNPDDVGLEVFGDAARMAACLGQIAWFEDPGATIRRGDFMPLHAVARMLDAGPRVAERRAVLQDLLACDPAAICTVVRGTVETARGMSTADASRAVCRLGTRIRRVAPALAVVDLRCVPAIPTFDRQANLAAATGLSLLALAWFGMVAAFSNLVPVVALSPILLNVGTLISPCRLPRRHFRPRP